MKTFQRYQEYKSSGVNWINDIPTHWLMRKVSRSFSTIGSGTTPSSGNDTYYKDGDILWVNSGDLNNGYLYDTEKKVTPLALKDFSALKLFQKNSLIIAMYGATIGKLALLESIACVNQACCVLNDSEYFEIKFVFYWFLANKQNIVNLSFGGGQPNISQDVIKSLKIQAPPLDEQKSIANFLDQKSKQIDEFIADKQALISLFEEQKKAIINNAVTKGLDKTAPLKPSGIEWLGEIPKNWVIIRLKYIGQAIIGLTYDPKEVTDENNGTLVLRSSNVQQGKIVYDDNVYVQTNIPEKLRTKKNDILICSRNGSRALIGKNAKIDNDSEGLTFGAFMTVFRSEFNDFMFYIFRSALFEFQSSSFLTSTVNQLTVGALNSFEVPFPPLEEQNQIVTYLETELAKIDTLIETAKAEITLIEEYKTSLINEAVTGKIKIHKEDAT